MVLPRLTILDIDSIRESPWNPNEMDQEKFEALKEDMRTGGLYTITNIEVFPAGHDREGQLVYQLIDGQWRFRAGKEVKWTKIRAEIYDIDEDEAKVRSYRKNRERGTFDPIKEAQLFFDDWKDGKGKLTEREIAEKENDMQLDVRAGFWLPAAPYPHTTRIRADSYTLKKGLYVFENCVIDHYRSSGGLVYTQEEPRFCISKSIVDTSESFQSRDVI